ncbi:unnamed protein product [Lampetra planeri]
MPAPPRSAPDCSEGTRRGKRVVAAPRQGLAGGPRLALSAARKEGPPLRGGVGPRGPPPHRHCRRSRSRRVSARVLTAAWPLRRAPSSLLTPCAAARRRGSSASSSSSRKGRGLRSAGLDEDSARVMTSPRSGPQRRDVTTPYVIAQQAHHHHPPRLT